MIWCDLQMIILNLARIQSSNWLPWFCECSTTSFWFDIATIIIICTHFLKYAIKLKEKLWRYMYHNTCFLCSYEVVKNNGDVIHNIQLNGVYKRPVGWTHWSPVRNTAMKKLTEERPVKTCDNNKIFLSFLFVVTFFRLQY